jgi:hypothetical protein
VFGRAKLVAIALPSLLLASGCLTPQMARKIDEKLGLAETPITERVEPRAKSAFDDAGLPARIWYSDDAAGIYHERRTNTYIAFDPVHAGWGAIPCEEAHARGFKPERAKLLAAGPPVEVKKVIDYLTSMEPGWRGG